jgi:hypothetical protein
MKRATSRSRRTSACRRLDRPNQPNIHQVRLTGKPVIQVRFWGGLENQEQDAHVVGATNDRSVSINPPPFFAARESGRDPSRTSGTSSGGRYGRRGMLLAHRIVDAVPNLIL